MVLDHQAFPDILFHMNEAFAHGVIVALVSSDNDIKGKLLMEDLGTRQRSCQMSASDDSGHQRASRVEYMRKESDYILRLQTQHLFPVFYKNKTDVKGSGQTNKQNWKIYHIRKKLSESKCSFLTGVSSGY